MVDLGGRPVDGCWPIGLDEPSVPLVLFRHDMPSGDQHYDLFVAREPHGRLPLWSLRCEPRLDHIEQGLIEVTRTSDHSPRWLRETDCVVSGGRGRAVRIAVGRFSHGDPVGPMVSWEGGGCQRWRWAAAGLLIERVE